MGPHDTPVVFAPFTCHFIALPLRPTLCYSVKGYPLTIASAAACNCLMITRSFVLAQQHSWLRLCIECIMVLSHIRLRSRGLQGLGEAFRQQISKLISSWSATSKSSLPVHNISQASNSNANIASLPNSNRLFLLNCIGYGRYTTRLSQQQLDDVRTDRQLFVLMRGQYLSKHWWRRLQSFRTLIGLEFVQVINYLLSSKLH